MRIFARMVSSKRAKFCFNRPLAFSMLMFLGSSSLLAEQNNSVGAFDEIIEMFEIGVSNEKCTVDSLEVMGSSPNRSATVFLANSTFTGIVEFPESRVLADYEREEGLASDGVPYWRVVGSFSGTNSTSSGAIPTKFDWLVDLEDLSTKKFILEAVLSRQPENNLKIDCSPGVP